MTMRCDHTSVPATDKVGEARGRADLFGVTVTPGHVAPVPVNEARPWTAPTRRNLGTGRCSPEVYWISTER